MSATDITKSFHGVHALRGVSFDLCRGEVHALCGENGAGKSTLMKVLSGYHTRDSFGGAFQIKGHEASFYNTKESQRSGVAIVYQELSSATNLSIIENLFLGSEESNLGFLDQSKMLAEAKQLLDLFNMTVSPLTSVGELGVGECQLIEIAKALRLRPEILILDEPTSALSDQEAKILFQVLRKLKAEGLGIVIITHRLNEIYQISDRITVLRDGESVGTWKTQELPEDQLIAAMVGREIKDTYPALTTPTEDVTLEVKNIKVLDPNNSSRYVVDDVSFSLRRGEILGVAGLMGAGRTELLLSLFGALSVEQGDAYINGHRHYMKSPEQSIKNGMALVTEDRKRYGLLLESDVAMNVTLSSLQKTSFLGWLKNQVEAEVASQFVDKLKIKTSSIKNAVQNLSGGNQQKVVIARCLQTQPKVLLMDEPTRGIDVGARQELYKVISDLAASGMSVLVASSELSELIGLCHRVLVLCEGRLTGEYQRQDISEEKVMSAATRFKKRNLTKTQTPSLEAAT